VMQAQLQQLYVCCTCHDLGSMLYVAAVAARMAAAAFVLERSMHLRAQARFFRAREARSYSPQPPLFPRKSTRATVRTQPAPALSFTFLLPHPNPSLPPPCLQLQRRTARHAPRRQ